jgi:hypothetical protein
MRLMIHTIQNLETLNLNPDFEFQQLLWSLKHVTNIIMRIRDMRCYNEYSRLFWGPAYVGSRGHEFMSHMGLHNNFCLSWLSIVQINMDFHCIKVSSGMVLRFGLGRIQHWELSWLRHFIQVLWEVILGSMLLTKVLKIISVERNETRVG